MSSKITIHSVAGYCYLSALWKMLVDLSRGLLENKFVEKKILMPDAIIIDGDAFQIIDQDTSAPTVEFYPPEGIEIINEASLVWSLGALVCYASSGHYIFGGRGGIYQHDHPTVGLPVLRKEHSELTALIQRCLCYSPAQRITLKDLYEQACKGLEISEKRTRPEIKKKGNVSENSIFIADDVWPEKMD